MSYDFTYASYLVDTPDFIETLPSEEAWYKFKNQAYAQRSLQESTGEAGELIEVPISTYYCCRSGWFHWQMEKIIAERKYVSLDFLAGINLEKIRKFEVDEMYFVIDCLKCVLDRDQQMQSLSELEDIIKFAKVSPVDLAKILDGKIEYELKYSRVAEAAQDDSISMDLGGMGEGDNVETLLCFLRTLCVQLRQAIYQKKYLLYIMNEPG
ncbi:hypothetical protein [Parachitinimonas caeni]|uniref:Uncharacterized protein n=1 Tax=Parachitinimonas caeni TaxID=3031301 RepID=A0ABT7DUG7_9NEIS|nr:hypothetical protein [Parachitinimonas caeni]MDK2123725.1 hypothetical protein [Parachitinimonas caeni]